MFGDRYISQNALISEIAKIRGNLNTRNVGQAIWDTPTADVIEVVRCRDCRYKDECVQYVLMCGDEIELAFCSYGERDKK